MVSTKKTLQVESILQTIQSELINKWKIGTQEKKYPKIHISLKLIFGF